MWRITTCKGLITGWCTWFIGDYPYKTNRGVKTISTPMATIRAPGAAVVAAGVRGGVGVAGGQQCQQEGHHLMAI
jgi:hypothetical protein